MAPIYGGGRPYRSGDGFIAGAIVLLVVFLIGAVAIALAV